MPLYQVNAGDRILAADANQYFQILKGVAASGETITLIYNAAASVIVQPSSDPAAGTEAIQIKNNAGTVQGSLTFDGKFKAADGTAALPSLRFQSEASGLYLSAAGVIGVAAVGATTNILMRANAISIGATPSTTGFIRLSNLGTILGRNAGNTADLSVVNVFSDDKIYIGDAVADQELVLRSVANVSLAPITAGNVNFKYAVTALGGGAAPTLGTIGGSGPGTAGQNSWLKVLINGTASYLPVWR